MNHRPIRLLILVPALALFAGVINWGLVGATLAALPEAEEVFRGRSEPSVRDESVYPVRGDQLVGAVSPETAAMWGRFVELVPAESRATVAAFAVFSSDEMDAYVSQLEDDTTGWRLALNEDLASRPYLLDRTLIHELGHLISFHPDQVPPVTSDKAWYQAAVSCDAYLVREGCSSEDSYLNRFVEEFWEQELLSEWEEIAGIADDERRMAAIESFAAAHRDDFVSTYAATNPEEDLAESFATYVLADAESLDGSIGERIRFFSAFPELVTLRDAIRAAQ
jgi:hypothetical protein